MMLSGNSDCGWVLSLGGPGGCCGCVQGQGVMDNGTGGCCLWALRTDAEQANATGVHSGRMPWLEAIVQKNLFYWFSVYAT